MAPVLTANVAPGWVLLPCRRNTMGRPTTGSRSGGADRDWPLTNRTRNKSLTILGGVMERARKIYGLPSNPARDVEKLRERHNATKFAFYSPEEVHALVRAVASEQDGAIYLTAAFTGLRRGELVALRWRDVDFQRSAIRVSGSYANGELTTLKSGHGRVVPMVPEMAGVLARLEQPSFGHERAPDRTTGE